MYEALSSIFSSLDKYPFLQLAVACLIVYGGVRVINKGEKDGESKRSEWLAYEQLKNIEDNTFAIKDGILAMEKGIEKLEENTRHLRDMTWNRLQ